MKNVRDKEPLHPYFIILLPMLIICLASSLYHLWNQIQSGYDYGILAVTSLNLTGVIFLQFEKRYPLAKKIAIVMIALGVIGLLLLPFEG